MKQFSRPLLREADQMSDEQKKTRVIRITMALGTALAICSSKFYGSSPEEFAKYVGTYLEQTMTRLRDNSEDKGESNGRTGIKKESAWDRIH